MAQQILSGNPLLDEARALSARVRVTLAETPELIRKPQTTNNEGAEMSAEITPLTPQRAGELYAGGQSVIEVARDYGMSYSQVRRFIATSGTPIRGASARLKGRTRKADNS